MTPEEALHRIAAAGTLTYHDMAEQHGIDGEVAAVEALVATVLHLALLDSGYATALTTTYDRESGGAFRRNAQVILDRYPITGEQSA